MKYFYIILSCICLMLLACNSTASSSTSETRKPKLYLDDFGRVITQKTYKSHTALRNQLKINDSVFLLRDYPTNATLTTEKKNEIIDWLNAKLNGNISQYNTILIELGTDRGNVRNISKSLYSQWLKDVARDSTLAYIEMITEDPLATEKTTFFKGQLVDSDSLIRNTFYPYHHVQGPSKKPFYGGAIFIHPDGYFERFGGDAFSDVSRYLKSYLKGKSLD